MSYTQIGCRHNVHWSSAWRVILVRCNEGGVCGASVVEDRSLGCIFEGVGDLDEVLSIINWAVPLLPRQSNGHSIISNEHRVDEFLLFESERKITNPEGVKRKHLIYRKSVLNRVTCSQGTNFRIFMHLKVLTKHCILSSAISKHCDDGGSYRSVGPFRWLRAHTEARMQL